MRFRVDDVLVVADPCYVDTDDFDGTRGMYATSAAIDTVGAVPTAKQAKERLGDLGTVVEDAGGEWDAYIDVTDDTGGWGRRVEALRLRRVGAFPTGTTVEIGENGVDSGQMFAGGLETLPLDYEALLKEYEDEDGEWVNRDSLEFGGGVVSSTGYGDGVYRVTARRDVDGRIAEVAVLFIEDEEEDDDYYR